MDTMEAGEGSKTPPTSGSPPATADSMSSKVGIGGNHVLSAVDLSYSIQVSVKDSKVKQSKTLIHPVTFNVKPTEMLAIMGASGAGKSTLLDVLAQRVPFSQVDGSYLLDGQAIQPTEFKRMSGYVMQDDALYPLLTVRETLRFAAELRIANLPKADKYELVEETIRQLKLTNCADTRIGNDMHRGVSGGEKRRVSIGVDTVQQPSIIFLDEPTSGLDSTTALTIVETLSSVCKRNRTVAMTIHQPSTRVLDVFDKVMFLSRGRMVYFGRPGDLPAYCTRLGKVPPAYSNISEFFLEIVDEYEAADNVKALSDHHTADARLRAPSTGLVEAVSFEGTASEYANPFIKEIGILLRRQWMNVLRTPELAVVRIGMCSFVALVLGSLFWNTNNDLKGLGNRAAYFAFAIALFLFTSMEALPIFLEERSIYTREHSRGAYRVVSYLLCNFLIYIPVFVVMSFAFTGISYFMIDLPPTGFLFQVLAIFMTLLQGNAFATFVSGAAPDALTGNSLGTAMMAFMFLFSGFFIAYDEIPVGWQWFSYLSMFKYPFEGMVKNMLEEEEERSGSSEGLELFAEAEGVDDVDMWVAVYGCVCFIVGFRFLFYLVLVFKHSGNRK